MRGIRRDQLRAAPHDSSYGSRHFPPTILADGKMTADIVAALTTCNDAKALGLYWTVVSGSLSLFGSMHAQFACFWC